MRLITKSNDAFLDVLKPGDIVPDEKGLRWELLQVSGPKLEAVELRRLRLAARRSDLTKRE